MYFINLNINKSENYEKYKISTNDFNTLRSLKVK